MFRTPLARRALDHLSEAERLSVTARAWRRVDFMTRNGLWVIVALACMAGASVIASSIIDPPPDLVSLPGAFACSMWLAFFAFLYFEYRRSVARIRQALTDELIACRIRPLLCLKCEYDLRGTTGDSCPECGEALAAVDESAENELV